MALPITASGVRPRDNEDTPGFEIGILILRNLVAPTLDGVEPISLEAAPVG